MFRYFCDQDDPDAMADMVPRSPISMIDRITTALLVAQGANDARAAQAESDNIVLPLREPGIEVHYLLAANEGHGFDNPENQIRLHRAIESHFAKHFASPSHDEQIELDDLACDASHSL